MICNFTGEYEFLSPDYPSKILYDGYWYPTVRHAFIGASCECDLERVPLFAEKELLKINANITLQEIKAEEVKRLSKIVKIRNDWTNGVREKSLYEILFFKYAYYSGILLRLLKTGENKLTYVSQDDSFLGIYDMKGRNEIGRITMRIRSKMRDVCSI